MKILLALSLTFADDAPVNMIKNHFSKIKEYSGSLTRTGHLPFENYLKIGDAISDMKTAMAESGVIPQSVSASTFDQIGLACDEIISGITSKSVLDYQQVVRAFRISDFKMIHMLSSQVILPSDVCISKSVESITLSQTIAKGFLLFRQRKVTFAYDQLFSLLENDHYCLDLLKKAHKARNEVEYFKLESKLCEALMGKLENTLRQFSSHPGDPIEVFLEKLAKLKGILSLARMADASKKENLLQMAMKEVLDYAAIVNAMSEQGTVAYCRELGLMLKTYTVHMIDSIRKSQ